ncbi:MAG: methyltransferase domain-containing protein [Magnetococcales bacterium]|nr:methyltransferase domain-containing protein [Magnetococcales bacterium]
MDKEKIYSGDEFAALLNSPNYYNWILDTFRPYLSGQVTEIGAGIGTFSELLLPNVETLCLVEPSANLNLKLLERFSLNNRVTISQATLEDFIKKPKPTLQDAIVLINVLEHIEEDAKAIMGLAKNLKVGGTLLLFVPALPFLFSKLDADFGHYRRYTLPNLVKIVEESGLNIMEKSYFDFLGVAPWWLINTMGKSTNLNPKMVGLYDTIGVPITRFMEGLISPPIGKNIIIAAKKI